MCVIVKPRRNEEAQAGCRAIKKNELKGMWKEVVVADICLETLRKAIDFSLTNSHSYNSYAWCIDSSDLTLQSLVVIICLVRCNNSTSGHIMYLCVAYEYVCHYR
jgi:hypothetical protein